MQFVNGIDVSDWNPVSSWKSVKASGYSFAITKATEGIWNTQKSFATNIAGIRAAGMIAGAYHFFDWKADPAAQARHFLNVYHPKPGDLPPTIDCEGDAPASVSTIAKVAAFLHELEGGLNGQRALIYCSFSFVSEKFPGGPFSGHPLWVAAYNNGPVPPVPENWHPKIWQFSDSAHAGGISGGVDANRFVGTMDDLRAFCLK